jgi:hypothetical protein
MTRANLALGHFEREQAGESERVLINMYAEPNEGDPARPVRLVTTPGTRDMDTGNVIQGNIRGMAQSDAFASGKVLVLDGTTLRTWVPSTGTWGTITGTVTGTDRADLSYTQTELAILSNGSIYVSGGSTVAVAGDVDFPTGITSIATYNQRIIMTTADGKWYYTAVLDIDNLTGLFFYSAESQPDNLVAVRVMGETILLFGTKTVELWYGDAGSANDPFSRMSNVIPKGCLCRDGIQVLDSSVIWVAEDRTVRQWAGGSATVISKPWITRALQGVAAADVIASTYEADGHAFYCLNTPTGCYVYDLLTQNWHIRQTTSADTWAWVRIISQDGKQYAAKRTGTAFMELSRAYPTDEQADASTFGTDISREWTAHGAHESGRPALGSVILEGSKGVGNAAGDGADPMAQMRISNDNGNTWTAYRSRSMGVQGDYDARAKWNQNGRGKRPQSIFHFKVVEPVKFDVTGVVFGEPS